MLKHPRRQKTRVPRGRYKSQKKLFREHFPSKQTEPQKKKSSINLPSSYRKSSGIKSIRRAKTKFEKHQTTTLPRLRQGIGVKITQPDFNETQKERIPSPKNNPTHPFRSKISGGKEIKRERERKRKSCTKRRRTKRIRIYGDGGMNRGLLEWGCRGGERRKAW